MKIYEFLYTDTFCEGGMVTVSLHKTKAGAYKAMRAYIEYEYNCWREEGILYGKQYFKFGVDSLWRIKPIELKD